MEQRSEELGGLGMYRKAVICTEDLPRPHSYTVYNAKYIEAVTLCFMNPFLEVSAYYYLKGSMKNSLEKEWHKYM